MRFAELLVLACVALLLAACGGGGGGTGLPVVEPAVVMPPAGAVVDARQWGTRDLALARTPGHATVSVVDALGHGIDGLTVFVDGRRAASCRNGCYRTPAAAGPVTVRIGGRTWRFTIPATAPDGRPLLRSAIARFARLRTVTLHETLGSGVSPPLVTNFVYVAPDRLRYVIRDGSQAVVIGGTRWDRPDARSAWERSPQTSLHVMTLLWRAIDAHVVAPRTVTFFDLHTHAWFRVEFSPSSLPLSERMTGISHFMVNSYSRFDGPASVIAPRAGH